MMIRGNDKLYHHKSYKLCHHLDPPRRSAPIGLGRAGTPSRVPKSRGSGICLVGGERGDCVRGDVRGCMSTCVRGHV